MSDASAYHSVRVPDSAARRVAWGEVARYLQPSLPADGTLLEIGAGKCLFSNAARARRRVAVDLLPDIAAYAADGVEAHAGDCTRLPFLADASVDAVFSACLLEHLTWEQLGALLAELKRVGRRPWRFLAVVPNFKHNYKKYFDDYTHRTVLTDVSVCEFLRAQGLVIERCIPRFLPDPGQGLRTAEPPLWLLRLAFRAYLRSPWRPGAGSSCGRAGSSSGSPR